jgi:hypothetical protein
VIYTCRKAEWDKEKTHFDANHLVTVDWSEADLGAAQERIVATIRNTLPVEAKIMD